MFRAVKIFWVLVLVCISNGCSSTRTNPLLSQAPDASLSEKEIRSIQKKAHLLWEKRHEAANLKNFITLQESLARSASANQTEMALLSRAYFFLGDSQGNLEDFERGANWAERALTFNSKFKHHLLDEKIPADMTLPDFEKSDAESLFWFVSNLEAWAKQSGMNTHLKYKDRAKRMMDRVAELSPHIFHEGVFRYYGLYYASAPGVGKTELTQSEKNFTKAMKAAPDCFATHVSYAETLAVKRGDQEAFKSHLNVVIHGSPSTIKDLYAEQVLEQEKAKKLLARTNELF